MKRNNSQQGSDSCRPNCSMYRRAITPANNSFNPPAPVEAKHRLQKRGQCEVTGDSRYLVVGSRYLKRPHI